MNAAHGGIHDEAVVPEHVNYEEQELVLQQAREARNPFSLSSLPHPHIQQPTSPLHSALQGFVANLQGSINNAYICSEVGTVKILADLVDNNTAYVMYCNNVWLADKGVMLTEAYAVKIGELKRIVAHLKGMATQAPNTIAVPHPLLKRTGAGLRGLHARRVVCGTAQGEHRNWGRWRENGKRKMHNTKVGA
ncbi:hypothetical protein EYR40_000423 [Pleurotus pulmonarius]|nr:hypothetical protein EYR36_001220 [Pleurotus pulmonarius]KAF4608079.1 hypothetical protein EYR40_000423 [Pleurotus pulmonarius]